MNASKENIVRVSTAEARLMKGRTDYARLDAMTDDDIAKAVASDPDAAPLDIDWDKASLVIPHTAKDIITLRLDHDVLEWLRSTGPGYQTRINKVLRAWFEVASKREKTAPAARETAKKTAAMLKLKVEPSAKEREASSWRKNYAAGPGFGAGRAHGFAVAKKSAAKRSAKTFKAKRSPKT
jgi:uncharacterized protein (DUF4415 family)